MRNFELLRRSWCREISVLRKKRFFLLFSVITVDFISITILKQTVSGCEPQVFMNWNLSVEEKSRGQKRRMKNAKLGTKMNGKKPTSQNFAHMSEEMPICNFSNQGFSLFCTTLSLITLKIYLQAPYRVWYAMLIFESYW